MPTSHDAVGLMLCVRVARHYGRIAQLRHIVGLEQYLERTVQMMLPRLLAVMEANTASIAAANAHRLSGGRGGELHPHYITRRYSEFASALAYLNGELADAHVAGQLARLRHEAAQFLARMASELNDAKRATVYLINSYDLILSVFHVRRRAAARRSARARRHAR